MGRRRFSRDGTEGAGRHRYRRRGMWQSLIWLLVVGGLTTGGLCCSVGGEADFADPSERCSTDEDCQDDNPCTTARCEGRRCVFENRFDGLPCGTGGVCLSGVCHGEQPDPVPVPDGGVDDVGDAGGGLDDAGVDGGVGYCGDGICEPDLGETCSSCPEDCGPCSTGICAIGDPEHHGWVASPLVFASRPRIAVDGLTVHVVFGSQEGQLGYVQSTDGGASFGVWRSLDASAFPLGGSTVLASGSAVLVLYEGVDEGQSVPRALRSTNGGTGFFDSPLVAAAGGRHVSLAGDPAGSAHAVWSDGEVVYLSTTVNGGAQWAPAQSVTSQPTNITSTAAALAGPALVVGFTTAGGDLLVVRRAQAGSGAWSSPVRVNEQMGRVIAGRGHWIAARDDEVFVVWTDARTDPDGDVYYARSIDGGATFGFNVRVNDVTQRLQADPSIAVNSEGALVVVWNDMRDADYAIYASGSLDGGATWCSSIRLNREQERDRMNASVALVGSQIYSVWRDNQNNTHQVYSRTGKFFW